MRPKWQYCRGLMRVRRVWHRQTIPWISRCKVKKRAGLRIPEFGFSPEGPLSVDRQDYPSCMSLALAAEEVPVSKSARSGASAGSPVPHGLLPDEVPPFARFPSASHLVQMFAPVVFTCAIYQALCVTLDGGGIALARCEGCRSGSRNGLLALKANQDGSASG